MGIVRLNELPEGSGSLTTDDIFIFMDDPSGSGVTKKISLSEISNAIGGGGGSGINFEITTVDLHNGGVQNAQVLQFTDSDYQSVITGPTPATDNNAQRLIVQGQKGQGTGEGGDVYVWGGDADTNGGDIKIYAGDADNNSSGYGGYVNIDGGSGHSQGGNVEITAGGSATQGGNVIIEAGYGSDINGVVFVRTGGNNKQWSFSDVGSLIFPNGTTVAVGTFDNGLGGNDGISLNCWVGYELNWQAGHLKSTADNGVTAETIHFDSPIDFPGSGVSDLTINASGITFPDGSIQRSIHPTVVQLGSVSGTINTDATLGDIFDLTLAASGTLANPSGSVDGQTIRWRISHNANSLTLNFGDQFKIPSSASSPLPISSTSGSMDMLGATYDSSRNKWDIIAFVPGY